MPALLNGRRSGFLFLPHRGSILPEGIDIADLMKTKPVLNQ